MEAKIAHLGFIQSTITRMASNSFLLKGWSVTLVAAIFALAPEDADKSFLFVAFLPILMFWFLDAFFLRQEKLYRALHEEVALGNIKSDHFPMDTKPVKNHVKCVWKYLISKTITPFHGMLAIMVAVSMLYIATPKEKSTKTKTENTELSGSKINQNQPCIYLDVSVLNNKENQSAKGKVNFSVHPQNNQTYFKVSPKDIAHSP